MLQYIIREFCNESKIKITSAYTDINIWAIKPNFMNVTVSNNTNTFSCIYIKESDLSYLWSKHILDTFWLSNLVERDTCWFDELDLWTLC